MLFLERHERNNILKHNTKNEHCLVSFDYFIESSFSSLQAKSNLVIIRTNLKWIDHVNRGPGKCPMTPGGRRMASTAKCWGTNIRAARNTTSKVKKRELAILRSDISIGLLVHNT